VPTNVVFVSSLPPDPQPPPGPPSKPAFGEPCPEPNRGLRPLRKADPPLCRPCGTPDFRVKVSRDLRLRAMNYRPFGLQLEAFARRPSRAPKSRAQSRDLAQTFSQSPARVPRSSPGLARPGVFPSDHQPLANSAVPTGLRTVFAGPPGLTSPGYELSSFRTPARAASVRS
jgi:hypothetical protein